MTADREGQQVDTFPSQMYGKYAGAVTPVLVDADGNLITATGLIIPPHDYIFVTYVASGNGIGEIETTTFKTGGSGGTVVAVLTLTYDGSNRLEEVTKT